MKATQINRAIDGLTILVDTREQGTAQAQERYKQFGVQYERKKLDFGDYSARCLLPDGAMIDLSEKVVIERKMSLDELCYCFGKSRERFEREFDRAKAAGAKIYLLVENATWRKVYRHEYRSRLSPMALAGSILTFIARYKAELIFCEVSVSGKLIADIMRYEMREELKSYGE